MNKTSQIVAMMCFLFATVVQAADAADERVKTALESENITFSETETHNFRAEFKTTEDRTNLVFVNSDTQKDGEYEHREVWAVACSVGEVDSASYHANRSEGYHFRELLVRLMARNSGNQTGGFRIVGDGSSWNSYLIIYSAIIPANASGEVLKAAMDACAFNADRLEADWAMQDKR